MHSTEPSNSDSNSGPGRRAIGMPRQFGVRAMLIITAIYAVLFALLTSVDAHPAVFGGVAVFVTGIGLGQMFLLGGKRPAEASMVAGASMFFLGAAGVVLALHVAKEPGDGVLLGTVVFTPAIGAALGYLVGGVIGGPFLLARWLGQRRREGSERPDGQPRLPEV